MTERLPIEIVQNLARQRARGGRNPLLLHHTSEGRPGERISHLPISQHLAEAWIKLTSAPFRPHHSLALSALRRNEPFALAGSRAVTRQTLHLLLYETLLNDATARALLLVPDDTTALLHLEHIHHLSNELATPIAAAHVDLDIPARQANTARILVTTPTVLHRRLLRHHDRAWQPFWATLHMLLIAEADHATGVAAAHLSRMLLRAMRLVPPNTTPQLAATIANVLNAEAALEGLNGEPWRIFPTADTPQPARTLAAWHAGSERLYDAAALAMALQSEGYRVHITCERLEIPLLLPLIGSGHGQDAHRISTGPVPDAPQVHIFAGAPESAVLLQQARLSDTRCTLLVLGNTPAERTLARLVEHLTDAPPPAWVTSATNAYVAAQHLLCAATERPLSTAEVSAWQAGEMVNRLERHQRLVRMPDDNAAWLPLASPGDPYEYDCFWLEAEGSSVIFLRNEQGTMPGTLDPAAFDRWGFNGAALPPTRGGYRVIERDDATSTLTIQSDQQGRTTFPLRTCEITMRDERASRMLRGQRVGYGRVVIDEEVYGYREVRASHAPEQHDITPALATRWSAPATWIDLPMRLKASGQLVGWSLVAALPLRILGNATDVVPAYDAGLGRLYLIDAQPGGNGIAAWVYDSLEMLLPLAYDIALDSRAMPLFEPAARLDMDWLLVLLGGEVALPEAPPPPPAAAPAPHRSSERATPPAPAPAPRESHAGASSRPRQPGPATAIEVLDAPAASQPPRPDQHHREEPPPAPAWLPTAEESPPHTTPTQPEQEIEHWDDTVPAWLPAPAEEPPAPPPARSAADADSEAPAPASKRPRRSGSSAETSEKRGKVPRGSRKKQPQRSESPASEQAEQAEPEREESAGGTRTRRAARKTAASSTNETKKAEKAEKAEKADRSNRRERADDAQRSTLPPDESAPPQEHKPDAAAIVERLQRLRQQQEAASSTSTASTAKTPRHNPFSHIEVQQRFQAGDTIFCRPYGYGTVEQSRIEHDRELLYVEFEDYGALEIDPSVSSVRIIEQTHRSERSDGE